MKKLLLSIAVITIIAVPAIAQQQDVTNRQLAAIH